MCFFSLCGFGLAHSFWLQNPTGVLQNSNHGGLQTASRTNFTCSDIHDQDRSVRCEFAKEYCEEEGFIPYVSIYYCQFEENTPGWVAVFGLWVVALIMILSNTAGTFFCSTIDSMTHILNIPQHIAGATLLAFGNGAPDLFTAIASFSGDGDNSVIGVSALVGAGIFVTTLVAGAVALVSPPSVPDVPKGLAKDIVWYLVAILALFLVFLDNKAAMWEAFLFLGIYLVYVGQVIFFHMWETRKRAPVSSYEESYSAYTNSSSYSTSSYFSAASLHIPDRSEDTHGGTNGEPEGPRTCTSRHHQRFGESGYGGKLTMIVSSPVVLCQLLTVPLVSEEEWSKPICLATCVCAPLAVAFRTGLWNEQVGEIQFWVIAAIISFVLFVVVMFTTEQRRPPKYPLPFALAGFGVSVIWVFTIADELVAVAGAIGEVLGVSDVVLGLTVLAWGNSMSDMAANVALARAGQASMALTGCFAGAAFNLLVGMGISLLITTIRMSPEPYDLSVNIDFPISVGFLGFSALFSLVYLWFTKFRLTWIYGALLLLIYVTFMTVSLLLQLGVILDSESSWT